MQAIVTKYFHPGNVRGARVKATCARGSIILHIPPELNHDEYHLYAANKLVEKFVAEDKEKYGTHKNPWSNPRTMAQLPTGDYVHVYVDMATIQNVVDVCEILNNLRPHDMFNHTRDVIQAAKTAFNLK